MFEQQIEAYVTLRKEYSQRVTSRMNRDDLKEYNEVLFSAHSCAIEGNSFSVNDTRELKEKGLGVIPQGKTLFEAFEMLDHFNAYEYLFAQADRPLTEELLKETHRILMLHTIAYKHPGAQAGEYTDTDMAAGDTLFGDHEQLITRAPQLLQSTQSALDADRIYPMIIAARFHGFYEYLHPFRDGNGRLGRLFANYILHVKGHPIVIIPQECKGAYSDDLRCIRTEGTDEYLIDFFFQTAIQRMQREIDEKKRQNLYKPFLF
ncbi:MAG: Fic family protein [bacterium]|nr:Fic family protein [bacterium]